MKSLQSVCGRLVAGTLFGLLAATAALSAAETWLPPTATSTNEGGFDVDTVSRPNGCQFVLRRYAQGDPALAGYWTQEVSIQGHYLVHLTRPPANGVKSMSVESDGTYKVLLVDRNGDGVYETILIYALPDRKLVEILMLTASGWWRHGSQAEFAYGEALLAQLLRPVQVINRADDRAIRQTWDTMKGVLTRPR